MKLILWIVACLLMVGCAHPVKVAPVSGKTPNQVVSEAAESDWLDISQDDLLYMQLSSGQVVMALAPDMAPMHAENTKKLVRQGVFNDTQFYRVLDGFVAQGGPMYADESEAPTLSEGSLNIAAEFTSSVDMGGEFSLLTSKDGYAAETGFYRGFAVGRDQSGGQSWLLHCYGALAMGRSNDIDSGGVALYVVNGPAQRYLDRNTTVFGRVLVGMEHVQHLKRTADFNGPVDIGDANQIIKISVGSDLAEPEQLSLQVLDTSSVTFSELMAARKNRSGEWFVYQHNHMDACGMPIPVREKP